MSTTRISTSGSNSNTRRRLTIADICADLGVSRSTFYEWRAKPRTPLPQASER